MSRKTITRIVIYTVILVVGLMLIYKVLYTPNTYVETILAAIYTTVIFCIYAIRPQRDGEFIINKNDPDKDIYTLGIGIPLGEVENRKYITLYIEKDQ